MFPIPDESFKSVVAWEASFEEIEQLIDNKSGANDDDDDSIAKKYVNGILY